MDYLSWAFFKEPICANRVYDGRGYKLCVSNHTEEFEGSYRDGSTVTLIYGPGESPRFVSKQLWKILLLIGRIDL